MHIFLLICFLLLTACSTQNSKNTFDFNEQEIFLIENVLFFGHAALFADELRKKN